MEPKDVVMLCLGIAAGLFALLLVIVSVKLAKIKKRAESEEKRADKVKIVHGERYSVDDAVSDAEGIQVTHLPGDFILTRNTVYRAERGGKLLPGTYTALSAGENDRNFKLRVGGLVKNFVHGDQIVIGDGEEICAVSATVILR